MSLKLVSINTLLDTHGVALADRGRVAYTAVARALAFTLPIPSSKVDSAYAYFIEKHSQEVLATLDVINEYFSIRMEDALELTKHLWVFRYQLVWDATNRTTMDLMDVIAQAGDRNIAPIYGELVGKYRQTLLTAQRIVTDALKQGE